MHTPKLYMVLFLRSALACRDGGNAVLSYAPCCSVCCDQVRGRYKVSAGIFVFVGVQYLRPEEREMRLSPRAFFIYHSARFPEVSKIGRVRAQQVRREGRKEGNGVGLSLGFLFYATFVHTRLVYL